MKIQNFYEKKGKHKKIPPGLAKKQAPPPGLQKHIVKHGELPPGLQGRRLPDELDTTLSPLPGGVIRLKVGVDVVLLDEKTKVVADVIWGVDL